MNTNDKGINRPLGAFLGEPGKTRTSVPWLLRSLRPLAGRGVGVGSGGRPWRAAAGPIKGGAWPKEIRAFLVVVPLFVGIRAGVGRRAGLVLGVR